MSEITEPRSRRRRADADRSKQAILAAAIDVLDQNGEAGLEAIATAAKVTRQTIYAHFPNRAALVDAVLAELTAEVVASLDRLDPDLSASDALHAFLETGWRAFDRHPLLLSPGTIGAGAEDLHAPVLDQLREIIERGKSDGSFTAEVTTDWLMIAVMALGHAAGEAVATGAMTRKAAWAGYRSSVDRLVG